MLRVFIQLVKLQLNRPEHDIAALYLIILVLYDQ